MRKRKENVQQNTPLIRRKGSTTAKVQLATPVAYGEIAVSENVKQNAVAKADRKEEVEEARRAEIIGELEKAHCSVAGIREVNVELGNRIISQVYEMQQIFSPNGASHFEKYMSAFQIVAELKPTNVTEAMLAVQMIGVHQAALMFLRMAALDGQTPEGRDANVLRATRLMRLFNDQLEAMSKLKGKTGQQKVTVEHVHVHEGGQAIVGAITAGKPGQGEGGQ